MQNTKIFIGGILIGGAVIGGIWAINNTKNKEAELFANKERCAVYTQKRQVKADELSILLGHSFSVQGFYSPTANTCMTNSQEIAMGHYIQRTLVDELTGQTEAFAFAATGKELTDLSLEGKQEQIAQDRLFGERLKYFQGIK